MHSAYPETRKRARQPAPQLAEYLEQEVMPDANEPLQTRVRKASAYFTEKIAALLSEGNQLFAAVGNQEAAMSLAAAPRLISARFAS